MADIHQRTVLHVARLYAPHIGGVETHVAQVSRELIKKGWKIQVITTQDKKEEPLHETQNQIEIDRIPLQPSQTKLGVWQWIWRHRQLFLAVDVIQVHDIFWWIWPIYLLTWSKIFVTNHGWEGHYPVRWQAKLQRWVNNKMSQGVMHVGAWIQEFYWDKPDVTTYGGVVTAKTAQVDVKQQPQQIVFFGRLTSENEVEKYIQLFKRLQFDFPNLTITWVGDGPLADVCKKSGQVTGLLVDSQKILLAADLVFANSYLSILDAQSYGQLVVSLYSHPLKQRYLETFPGFQAMILANDIDTAAQKIANIFANPTELEKYSSKAKHFAVTQTWQKVTNLYLRLWQRAD